MHSYLLYLHSPDNTKQQDILCPSTECLLTLLFLCQPILFFFSIRRMKSLLGTSSSKNIMNYSILIIFHFPSFQCLFVAVVCSGLHLFTSQSLWLLHLFYFSVLLLHLKMSVEIFLDSIFSMKYA